MVLYFNKLKFRFQRMVLYHATVTALYPCLYVSNVPSSTISMLKENSELFQESASESPIKFIEHDEDLETTSEGLCDFVRELFCIDRPKYNAYQMQVLKKILFKKSHPQVNFFFYNYWISLFII
jgi:hypothetical protein